MDGEYLITNTIGDNPVRFKVKDRDQRWSLYCKPVKITVELISEEELKEEAKKVNEWIGE